MRALAELLDRDEPALPLIQAWAQEASIPVECLPPSAQRDSVLLALQVTTRSPLGAMAHGTGGILIDGGWLRMLGSGHPRLTRDLAAWNRARSSGFLLIADDAVGGFFAINGGALGEDLGAVHYLAPDTWAWESLEMRHTAFVQWAFTGGLRDFYRDLRWEGWEAEVAGMGNDACMSFYPFLFTEQGSVLSSARKPVPAAEHYAFMSKGG
ncbi:DUF2625 domain-containing protein [Comamonas testosteroni]|uniref:Protein of uncharacterized function DUF2625 n=1 Tax=Comamonas testosteroni TaxID=285 RepID=A0A8B4S3H7_COMTE|nr:DUF2625 domain-containing protein [Comamonas testosteroni]EHN63782.1 hypothetical protein CTATCC11996_19689 [Comamonas testosteroni ATCC 11996]QQN68959.1 DUF2625 domain-containing protein [Comamonas testosteroni]SUY77694.1 Protein of uncharacterised function DUF2625 [Comamonas testosteroni]